ncbi:hypothetical protein B0O99DRAFT_682522 [Bisporella sp. PMI_857]|nr:hypothetical protein B0O99DRAFT_682522 [Bisporella sp. PMI_857]
METGGGKIGSTLQIGASCAEDEEYPPLYHWKAIANAGPDRFAALSALPERTDGLLYYPFTFDDTVMKGELQDNSSWNYSLPTELFLKHDGIKAGEIQLL